MVVVKERGMRVDVVRVGKISTTDHMSVRRSSHMA